MYLCLNFIFSDFYKKPYIALIEKKYKGLTNLYYLTNCRERKRNFKGRLFSVYSVTNQYTYGVCEHVAPTKRTT